MALPLILLGSAVSALLVNQLAQDRKTEQRQRRWHGQPKSLQQLQRHEAKVAIYPTELLQTEQTVRPVFGAIVCCGIAGVFEHTGIWIDDDTIVELNGNGLISAVSSQRFVQQRTGSKIFIACDSRAQPLAQRQAGQRAIAQIYQYQPYHVLKNNCHQFVWRCFAPDSPGFTSFKTLNERLAVHFNRQVYWDLMQVG